ncbi:MAG: recombinase family protein [Bacteroidaceae bacterium]|nr:recombinase family protein [Bacteroidaceae bacterium]
MENLKAVIYARYSSNSQREESIEGQIRDCTAYAERNGYMVIGAYADRAISGTTDDRPEFQKMIKDSKRKQFDLVIVWKLDRFARNRYVSAKYKAQLRQNGVRVISANETISDGAAGILTESILEGMAEWYSENLKENVIRGLSVNAEKCKWNGGTLPIGYVVDEEQHLQPNRLTAPFVVEAFKMYDEGHTLTQIRDHLNGKGLTNTKGRPLTYGSIQHMLSNRRYIGEYAYRETIVPNGIPAIVALDLFERVQEKLEKNKKAPARAKADEAYLLTTKLFCGHCGTAMNGESGKSRNGTVHRYYKCHAVKKKLNDCKKKSVRKEWVEDLVVNATMEMLQDDDTIEAIVSMLMRLQDEENTDLPMYEKQLMQTETAIDNIVTAVMNGMASKALQAKLTQLEDAKEELLARIAEEKLEKPKISAEFMTFWLHRFRKLDVTKEAHRQMLIDTFVNAVFVHDDKLLLTFNFKEGTRTITLNDVKEATCSSGSDLDCFVAPKISRPQWGRGIFSCSRTRTHLNATRTSVAAEGLTEANLNFLSLAKENAN